MAVPFEVVIADESPKEEQEKIIRELSNFNSAFPWTLVGVNPNDLETHLGFKKFHNNPSLTNNVAFYHCSGDLIFLMGNECIAYDKPFDKMLEESKGLENFINFSTTYDIPKEAVDFMELYDQYGTTLTATKRYVEYCKQWPLADDTYHSDVTNYLSLTTRNVWEAIGGYDETYLKGIACEDSDFVRRARTLPNFKTIRSKAISLHQYHGGKTRYYEPVERGMTDERWNEGLSINRKHYNSWDGTRYNPQRWAIRDLVVDKIVTIGEREGYNGYKLFE